MDENGYPIDGYKVRYAHNEEMSEATEAVPSVVRDEGFDRCDLRHLRKLKYYFQAPSFTHESMAYSIL